MVAWVKIRGGGTLMVANQNSGDHPEDTNISLGNGYVHLAANDEDGNKWTRFQASSALLTAKVWHQVAVTRTGNDSAVFYVDGVAQTSPTKSCGSKCGGLHGALPTTIGKAALTGGKYFSGAIDQMRVWSRVLTAKEIKAIFDAEAGSAPPTCTVDSDCPAGQVCASQVCALPENTHLECSAPNQTCGRYVGKGDNQDGCTTIGSTCSRGTEAASCQGNKGENGRCYDCNGDGEINILDFSCFAKRWLERIT